MENLIKTLVAIGGGAASYFLGGWSSLLGVLLAFVVIDYISGVVAAAIEGKLNSAVGLKGISKKVFVFVLVGVANLVDVSLGDTHFFRDATIFFYLANELLSILENAGRVGVPIGPLGQAVELLKGRGEIKK